MHRCVIKYWRQQRGMTQAQLAERVGISQATLSRYETGEILGIPYVHVRKLAHELGVTPVQLLEDEDVVYGRQEE